MCYTLWYVLAFSSSSAQNGSPFTIWRSAVRTGYLLYVPSESAHTLFAMRPRREPFHFNHQCLWRLDKYLACHTIFFRLLMANTPNTWDCTNHPCVLLLWLFYRRKSFVPFPYGYERLYLYADHGRVTVDGAASHDNC